MSGSGQQSVAQRYAKQDVTITETITQIVCRVTEEEEEVDSQTMGADLQGPVCETYPADI